MSRKFISEPIIINFDNCNNNLKIFNKKVNIRFLTLTRIQFEGKISDRIEFHVLIRNLLRRVSHLYYFHIDKDIMKIDFNYYINKSINSNTDWHSFKHNKLTTFNSRQRQKIDMNGIIGEATYHDVSSEFISLLKLGEYLNIGKGTSFGLGRYKLYLHDNN